MLKNLVRCVRPKDSEYDNLLIWMPYDEYAQECIMITDDETVFNNAPSYIVLKIKY